MPDQAWPTLGELIEADTRIVVFAENEASGGVDWYHATFEDVQDTPSTFENLEERSCDLNGVDADNGRFLVNRWLGPASPRSATAANEADVISERFVRCADERGRILDLFAVDFHGEGDLVETVADLDDR